MTALPTGTVTLLFTDIEGSTKLLQALKGDYETLLAVHEEILRAAIARHDGRVVDTQGDSFFAAFPRAADALNAVVDAQRALHAHEWEPGKEVRVRMALHTGEPDVAGERYVGMDVHRAARIGAAGYGGQVLVSQTTRELVESELPAGVMLRDLGEHQLKDLRRPKHIYQLVIAGLPSEFPPLKTLDALPNNLPIQLTSFVGRERDLKAVRDFLGDTRLLTLTGAGGTGKTRLALQAAAEVLEAFQHGVWLVELAAVTDPGLVPETVAAALELREQPGRSALDVVSDFLRTRELLLLLDNCEHLINACADFSAGLLRHCPRLRILATSREPLGVAGEVIWSVPSLSVPHRDATISLAALEEFEAVKLFTERACAVQPHFRLTETNSSAVIQVCARLDGIPLALELAAARVRGMGVEQIAARLDNRFRLLSGGARNVLPRQQTLGALIDWSYDLLSEAERSLFRRLTIFVGPFSLEAVEQICDEDTASADETLDLLLRLVDKSLVLTEERHGETYYYLLETIRQYGREKLIAFGEAEQLADGHAQYFRQLAVRADRELRGLNQLEWIRRLGVMRDNLRAALEWLIETKQTGAALEMAVRLDWFWFITAAHNEGSQWLSRVLALDDAHKYPEAQAEALTQLAHHTWLVVAPNKARPYVEEALSIAQGAGDTRRKAKAQAILGLVLAREMQFAAAEMNLLESKALFQEIGDKWEYAHTIISLAVAPTLEDDRVTALALFEQALALFRELGDRFFSSVALRYVGNIRVKQGDIAGGIGALREALQLIHVLDSKIEIGAVLWSLAEALELKGDTADAVRLYCVTKNVLESIAPWEEKDDAKLRVSLARCRAVLGETEFDAAFAEGFGLKMEQAIELALGENSRRQ